MTTQTKNAVVTGAAQVNTPVGNRHVFTVILNGTPIDSVGFTALEGGYMRVAKKMKLPYMYDPSKSTFTISAKVDVDNLKKLASELAQDHIQKKQLAKERYDAKHGKPSVEERNKQITALLEKGMTPAKISEQLGIKESTVNSVYVVYKMLKELKL